MNSVKRRIAALLVMSAAGLVLGALGNATPASAEGDRDKVYCGGSRVACFDVGVNSSGGQVFGYSGDSAVGFISIYVTQCRGDLSGCGTISANAKDGVSSLATSSKPTAFGHVYRTCGSFKKTGVSILNVCSPWVTA